MQNSIWKIVAAVGIIGIGTLVVLEVQQRLPQLQNAGQQTPLPPDAQEFAGIETGGIESNLTPDSTTDFDRLMSQQDPADVGFSDATFADTSLTEPTPNTPPAGAMAVVDTTVRRSQLYEGDNPFGDVAEEDGHSHQHPHAEDPVQENASGVMLASGNNQTAEIKTVGFQQDQPFPIDGSPSTSNGSRFESLNLNGNEPSEPELPAFTFDGEPDPFGEPAQGNPAAAQDGAGSQPAGSSPRTGGGEPILFFGADESATANPRPAPGTRPAPIPGPAPGLEPIENSIPNGTRQPGTTGDNFDSGFTPDPFEAEEPFPTGDPTSSPSSGASPPIRQPGIEENPFQGFDPVPMPRPNGSGNPVLRPDSLDNSQPPAPVPSQNPDPRFSRPAGPDSNKPLGNLDAEPEIDFFREDARPSGSSPDNDILIPQDRFNDGARTTPDRTRSPVDMSPVDVPSRNDFPGFDSQPADPTPRNPSGNDRRTPLSDPFAPDRGTQENGNAPSGDFSTGRPNDRLDFPAPGDNASPITGPSDGVGLNNDDRLTNSMRPHVTLRKDAPAQATVGVPMEYVITVSNDGQTAAYEVTVEDEMASGVTLDQTVPQGEYDRTSRKLRWVFDRLQPNERQQIRVSVVPTGEGTIDSVASVRFKSQVRASTVITAPRLALDLSGPSEVRLGEEVDFRFEIRNDGSGDAGNVILRSVLPSGLKHPEGNDLEYEIPLLPAGEKKEIVLTVVASEPGEFRPTAEVASSGLSTATDDAVIEIVGAQLTVERHGPERRFVGRPADFRNIITNNSNFEATNCIVQEQIPAGMTFVSAPEGSYDDRTGIITWKIDRIAPGKQRVLDVQLKAQRSGQLNSIVDVIENAGFRSQATRTVSVEDIHNIGADIRPLEGPVQVGEKFTFAITLDNRGTADADNVEVRVQLPPQVRVLSADAADGKPAQQSKSQNMVIYNAISKVQPGEQMRLRLILQGDQPVRNGVISAVVRYSQMKDPLYVSESVTVFSDTP
ncbi:MAG: DUF11 domain-containing protein [Planctomycetaceae bacterium]|nr:DUF11 domain-containing protein [Planctomycetaceae bacterium]